MSLEKRNRLNKYDELTSQQYLNAKQLTVLSVFIICLIQLIPILVERTDTLEWMLLGFTAGVSTCAVVGAILVQYNADKIANLYKNAFDKDFYETIHLFTTIKTAIQNQAEEDGIDFSEEVNNLGINSYSFVKGYLESFKEHYNLSQNEVKDEIIEAPEYENEAELFS